MGSNREEVPSPLINGIWLGLIVIGFGVAALQGRLDEGTVSFLTESRRAVDLTLALGGTIAVWFGVSRVAQEARILDSVGRRLAPLLRFVFPDLARDHPALTAIALNLAANIFGLGNAATPFGLQAMQELQATNRQPRTATPAMITFLALNSAVLTLVPSGAIALRAATGSSDPAQIVEAVVLTTGLSMAVVLAADRVFRRLSPWDRQP